MTNSNDLWQAAGDDYGWTMPRVPGWWRWWGVRHVRALWSARQVSRHNAFYRSLGMLPTGYDQWVMFGIWHGLEGKHDDPGEVK